MWELDYKESWALKNWCFWTIMLEKTLESPLDFKEIKPVNPEGNQSWIFIGRSDAETEITILWPPDVKNWLLGKDPATGKDWSPMEKGMTEDWIVEWHHWVDWQKFEQAPEVGERRGSQGPITQGMVKSQMQLDLNESPRSLINTCMYIPTGINLKSR